MWLDIFVKIQTEIDDAVSEDELNKIVIDRVKENDFEIQHVDYGPDIEEGSIAAHVRDNWPTDQD